MTVRAGPTTLLTDTAEPTATTAEVSTNPPQPVAPSNGGSFLWPGMFIPLTVAFIAAFIYRRQRWVSRPAEERAFIRLASAAGFDREARRDFEASARRAGVAPLAAIIERSAGGPWNRR